MSRYAYEYGDSIIVKETKKQGIYLSTLKKSQIKYFDLEDNKNKTISILDVEYLPPKECDFDRLKSFLYLEISYKELVDSLTERNFNYDTRPSKKPRDITNEQLFNINIPNYTLTLEDFKIIVTQFGKLIDSMPIEDFDLWYSAISNIDRTQIIYKSVFTLLNEKNIKGIQSKDDLIELVFGIIIDYVVIKKRMEMEIDLNPKAVVEDLDRFIQGKKPRIWRWSDFIGGIFLTKINDNVVYLDSDSQNDLREYLEEKIKKDNVFALEYKANGCFNGNELYDIDLKLAKYYYHKIYDLTKKNDSESSAKAAQNLGFLYCEKIQDEEPDYRKAYEYFSMASILGLQDSEHMMIDMLYKGYGVQANPSIAKYMLEDKYQLDYDEYLEGNNHTNLPLLANKRAEFCELEGFFLDAYKYYMISNLAFKSKPKKERTHTEKKFNELTLSRMRDIKKAFNIKSKKEFETLEVLDIMSEFLKESSAVLTFNKISDINSYSMTLTIPFLGLDYDQVLLVVPKYDICKRLDTLTIMIQGLDEHISFETDVTANSFDVTDIECYFEDDIIEIQFKDCINLSYIIRCKGLSLKLN